MSHLIAETTIRTSPDMFSRLEALVRGSPAVIPPADRAGALSYLHDARVRAELSDVARMEGGSLGSTQISVDTEEMWKMMADKMYGGKDVVGLAVREALQNGVDAIRNLALFAAVNTVTVNEARRLLDDPEAVSRFTIFLDPKRRIYGTRKQVMDERDRILAEGGGFFSVFWKEEWVEGEGASATLVVEDNGIGMDQATLVGKFLRLAASGKAGGGDVGLAGGFGVAKAVIFGASTTRDLEITTRNIRAVTTPGTLKVNLYSAPMTNGTRIEIRKVKAEQRTGIFGRHNYGSPEHRIRTLLSACYTPDVTLSLNGEVVPPLFPSRGEVIPLPTAPGYEGTIKARLHKRDAKGDPLTGWVPGTIFVRLHGQPQFAMYDYNQDVGDISVEDDKGNEISTYPGIKTAVVVDLETSTGPKEDNYPFNAARDAFSTTLGEVISSITSYTRQIRSDHDEASRKFKGKSKAEVFDTFLPEEEEDGEGPAATLEAIFGDKDFRDAMKALSGKVGEFYKELEKSGSAAADRGAVGHGTAGDIGEGREHYTSWRDMGEVMAGADPSTPEGVKAIGEVAEKAVTELSDGGVIAHRVQSILDMMKEGYVPTKEEALAVAGVLGKALQRQRDRSDRGSPTKAGAVEIRVGIETLEKLREAAGMTEEEFWSAGTDGTPAETPAPGEKPKRKKRERINPFGALGALKINLKEYDKEKAKAFRRNAKRWVPYLTLWAVTTRLIAEESHVTIPFTPGFILENMARAMASRETTSTGRDHYLILINPDGYSDYVEAHKERPFAIAGYLHTLACHELSHLPTLGTFDNPDQAHGQEFIREREALGVDTAHLLPLLELAVVKILPNVTRVAVPGEARESSTKVKSLEAMLARVRRENQEAGVRAKAAQQEAAGLRGELLAANQIASAVIGDLREVAHRLRLMDDYAHFRSWLLTSPASAAILGALPPVALVGFLEKHPQGLAEAMELLKRKAG